MFIVPKNYVCRTKKEAQSSYYSRDSMTVQPMVVMFPQGEEISLLYFDVISDNLKHDGSAVKVFLNRLASHLSTNYPHVKCLHIWSDGCGVLYKSRLPMLNMSKTFDIPQKVF